MEETLSKKLSENEIIKEYESIFLEKGYVQIKSSYFTEEYLKKQNRMSAYEELKLLFKLQKNNAKIYSEKIIEYFEQVHNVDSVKNDNILFDSKKIIPIRINSVNEFLSILNGTDSKSKQTEITEGTFYNENIFYRGQNCINFRNIAGIYRNDGFIKNERKIFKDTIIQNAELFRDDETIFEKLTCMQHYRVPTRLLDLTKNPLVALYFSCKDNDSEIGEITVYESNQENEKYFDDEKVSILSNISQVDKLEMDLNGNFSDLENIVKRENPTFSKNIKLEDLEKCFFVKSNMSNKRILNQQGLFLLVGIKKTKNNQSEVFDYQKKQNDKIFVFYIPSDKKKKILKQLEMINLGIDFIYPDIENIAIALKQKYGDQK